MPFTPQDLLETNDERKEERERELEERADKLAPEIQVRIDTELVERWFGGTFDLQEPRVNDRVWRRLKEVYEPYGWTVIHQRVQDPHTGHQRDWGIRLVPKPRPATPPAQGF